MKLQSIAQLKDLLLSHGLESSMIGDQCIELLCKSSMLSAFRICVDTFPEYQWKGFSLGDENKKKWFLEFNI